MIQLAMAACLGAWAYIPADLESDVAFKLNLNADSEFEMAFSDFGRASGRWNRHRDNSYDLMEGSEKIATIKDCHNGSATVLINDRELPVSTYQAETYPVAVEDTTAIDAEIEAENASRRWKPVRSGQWLIQVNATSSGKGNPSCNMRTNDVLVSALYEGDQISVAASGLIQNEMSRLRSTTAVATTVTAIFDGDVRVQDTFGQRQGRYLTVTGYAQLLRFVEEANTVTFLSSTDSSRTLSLAGSEAAGRVLRRCVAHVTSEADLYLAP
ncbi:hypothetical protein [Brevundimonas sp.]|uniref:hypothetical protein n=1 Tax=Brevundimonas sp. TaxID=1871086 RepID=UPI0028989D6F|nr:hypothetical protein [Brevundimonas sp.]